MSGFELSAVCRAPALDVFKLLHDPARFPDWWRGTERVETEGGDITRYMSAWPDFAYPTTVSPSADAGCVVISCLISNIVHEWRIEPHADGCALRVRVELPEGEAARVGAQREEVGVSLRNLVTVAEAEAP